MNKTQMLKHLETITNVSDLENAVYDFCAMKGIRRETEYALRQYGKFRKLALNNTVLTLSELATEAVKEMEWNTYNSIVSHYVYVDNKFMSITDGTKAVRFPRKSGLESGDLDYGSYMVYKNQIVWDKEHSLIDCNVVYPEKREFLADRLSDIYTNFVDYNASINSKPLKVNCTLVNGVGYQQKTITKLTDYKAEQSTGQYVKLLLLSYGFIEWVFASMHLDTMYRQIV